MEEKIDLCITITVSLFAKKLVAPPTRALQLHELRLRYPRMALFNIIAPRSCFAGKVSGFARTRESTFKHGIYMYLHEVCNKKFFGKSNVREFGCSPWYCFYWFTERP